MLFYPYTEFPLVSFDLENKSHEIWRAPSVLAGSNGITSAGGAVYFHSPYDDEQGIYEWRIGDDVARRIGERPGYPAGAHARRLRGLRGGRFLAVEKSGYTVISPTEI